MNAHFSKVFPLVIVCGVALFGCSSNRNAPHGSGYSPQEVATTSAAIADNDQRLGIMSSADYLHWEKVGDSVSAQRHMSDNDLAWAISMLQKPSTQPAEVHEMMIGLFLTMKTFEPMQKEKIRDAVLPLTNTRDPVEAKYVKVVLRRIDAV